MATTVKQITNLLPPTAPRLPTSPVEWDHRFMEQYSNVMRLYFNNLDSTVNNLLGEPSIGNLTRPGGVYLSFPYAAVQRTTDKTFTANTPTLITFDQNDYLNGCLNDTNDGIVVNTGGIYNYQFSVQFANMDNQIHTGYIWLRINGVDVPGTGSKFDVPGSHGGVDGYLIAACNFYVQMQPTDNVELWAAVSNTDLYMEAYAANAHGFTMPSIPSVVATLSFVSRLSA